MARFRDFSIRRKLLFINVLTTSTALGLASTAFITYERLRFQADIDRQLSTVADVIGASARSSLAGHDKAGAEQVLRGLTAEPRILAACLFEANGVRRACYAREQVPDPVYPPAPGPSGLRSESGDLVFTRPVRGRDLPSASVWIRFTAACAVCSMS